MKTYSDLEGDGGSNVIGQVVSLQNQIKQNLSQIKHIIAIGSGKGGVGKSTLTMQLAAALNHLGQKVSLLDADVNGPSLARLSGLQDKPMLPGENGLTVPLTQDGIGVISFGSMVPESEAVNFPSVSQGESHTWRATKEFSTLAQFLAYTDWGKRDFLLIDLPPGAERVFQFAEFLGEQTKFILITIPSQISQGVVRRSIDALNKTNSNALGLIKNMSGYFCKDCGQIKELFPNSENKDLGIPLIGEIPFDPTLANNCDQGITIQSYIDSPVAKAVINVAQELIIKLENKNLN
ncbi:hypothetical protein BVY03_02250 [bacterium K02(2017)]|nr:hypothetical protein BVY03_02250 [bacterium K02(2017)]